MGCVQRHRFLQQLASLLCAISKRFDMTQSDQCSCTVTLLFVRFSVAATPAGRLPARERNTMTRKRRKIRLRMSHIPITVLYTLQLLLVSLRTRISPSGESSGHRPPAQLVTGRYLNMVTNLHIAGPKPSRASSGLFLLGIQLSG